MRSKTKRAKSEELFESTFQSSDEKEFDGLKKKLRK